MPANPTTCPGPPLGPEEWLLRRFRNMGDPNPRYENSFYGPHCALLSHYFPYQRQFLIKPQSKIRPPYEPMEDTSFSSTTAERSFFGDNLDDESGDISLSSTGAVVLPRRQGGSEQDILIPDFIVAKATEFATQDRSILFVEDKPEETMGPTAAGQLVEYMEAYARDHDVKDLTGLLICGQLVEILTLASPADQVEVDPISHNITSLRVRELLHKLACDNWDIYNLH